MKFIYASDIHGDMNKYNALFNLCKLNSIYTIVLGGDLLPKYLENRELLQRNFIYNELQSYYELLAENDIRLIQILGNDDLEIIESDYYKLISKFDNIYDVNEKKVNIDDLSFIGLNKVLDAPFKRKDHVVIEKNKIMPYQKSNKIYVDSCRKIISLEEWKTERLKRPYMIDCLNKLPECGEKTIYIFHAPPSNVLLDWCYDGDKAGSDDIYNFLYESHAYMSLHGHIHESFLLTNKWNANINGTISIQLGQSEYGQLNLIYAIIDTDNEIYERFDSGD